MALNSFNIDGSPFSLFEGTTISGVITLRIVVVVGQEVGTVVAVDVDFEDCFANSWSNLYLIESFLLLALSSIAMK